MYLAGGSIDGRRRLRIWKSYLPLSVGDNVTFSMEVTVTFMNLVECNCRTDLCLSNNIAMQQNRYFCPTLSRSS